MDHLECLKTLKKAGYKGYVALEYEGSEYEDVGVPKSLDFTRKVIQEVD